MKHFSRRMAIAAMGLMLAGPALAAPDATAPRTESDLPDVTLTALGTLPRSPEKGSLDQFCDHYRVAPESDAGKLVAGRGWIVTSEAKLGSYQVVSFASGFEPGTSGICFARNANIGIFSQADLVALAYTAKTSKTVLGPVAALDGGAVQVWGGDGPGSPIGEIHDVQGVLRLQANAAEQPVCGGKAVVPNIYDKSIPEARKLLAAKGWAPKAPDEAPTEFDGAAGLAKHGIIEAETCSGTGVGYCAFNYSGPAGTLSVTTVGGEGEDGSQDTVVSYSARCS